MHSNKFTFTGCGPVIKSLLFASPTDVVDRFTEFGDDSPTTLFGGVVCIDSVLCICIIWANECRIVGMFTTVDVELPAFITVVIWPEVGKLELLFNVVDDGGRPSNVKAT